MKEPRVCRHKSSRSFHEQVPCVSFKEGICDQDSMACDFDVIIIEKPKNEGNKQDHGKDRWDLLPWYAVQEVVKVLTFGANKYGDENWKKVENLDQRYFAASMRHEIAYKSGQGPDDESGLHHLAHKICCDLFRLESELQEKNLLDKNPIKYYHSDV